jgi:hypothetical protein
MSCVKMPWVKRTCLSEFGTLRRGCRHVAVVSEKPVPIDARLSRGQEAHFNSAYLSLKVESETSTPYVQIVQRPESNLHIRDVRWSTRSRGNENMSCRRS